MTPSNNTSRAAVLLGRAAAGMAPDGLVALRAPATARIGTASIAELQRIVNRVAAAS